MKILVCVFLLVPVVSIGQRISSDFENNDLTGWFQSDSGHWCISDADAISGIYSLGHCYDNGVSATDWITFFHQPVDPDNGTTRWDFTVRYTTDPSANNYWVVCLNDNCLPDTEGRLVNGLIIGINYLGNSDEIKVWEVHDGELECLLNTGFNWETNNLKNRNVRFSIQCSHDIGKLYLATSESDSFDLGNFWPKYSSNLNAFTLLYTYTMSNDRSLWFDDLILEAVFLEDQLPPCISYYSFIDAYTVEVGFSEPVLVRSDAPWCIEGIGCGTANTAMASVLEIEFSNPMEPGYSYLLELPEISDVYGNVPDAEASSMELYCPASYDIVISEILADPLPPVLLPEAEYVELFNAGTNSICVKDWLFSVNAGNVKIPCITLPPRTYLVLCDREHTVKFETNLNVAGIEDFPVLANSGAGITLQNRSGSLMHFINYDDSWYASPDKREGGWSLEIINPWTPCDGNSNWAESEDYTGGTPATENSVLSARTFDSSPELWRSALTETGSLMLYFSEPLDSTTACSVSYYTVNHSIGTPDRVIPAWPVADRVELIFNQQFEAGTEYTVSLSSDICDCSGNRMIQHSDSDFSIPEKADSSDVIINEILFDPDTDHNEFIELFNTSRATIDLKEYRILVGERGDSGNVLTLEYWPLRPGDYCLIARGYRGIDSPGKFEYPERILHVADMPRLPNAGITLYLTSAEGAVIDIAAYSPDWHHEILAESKGVSLERISASKSGLEHSNWQSASSDADYMTPAARNSQQLHILAENDFILQPETITPNSDGADEELVLLYRLDEVGYMGRILIFDIYGRICRILANGALFGSEGSYIFDGRDYSGSLVPTGYYIAYFEAYHRNGKRYATKKSFVVAH